MQLYNFFPPPPPPRPLFPHTHTNTYCCTRNITILLLSVKYHINIPWSLFLQAYKGWVGEDGVCVKGLRERGLFLKPSIFPWQLQVSSIAPVLQWLSCIVSSVTHFVVQFYCEKKKEQR